MSSDDQMQAVNDEETESDAGPRIFLIMGLMAAGKSTVAQCLAERLPMSVHLRGDAFRRMIVNGQAQMDFNLTEEALRQLRLRYQISATVSRQYYNAGFNVVYQDIILGSGLNEVIELYRGLPLRVIVLCPSPETVATREAGRSKTGYRDVASIADFNRVLLEETPRLGLWLDTSNLTPQETVELILSRLNETTIA